MNEINCSDRPVGGKVQVLARKIKYIADDNLAKLNVTLEQVKILRYIYFECNNTAVNQKDIEKKFDIKRSSVTNILQNMERGELLTRSGDAKDARIKKVQLSKKGVEYAIHLKSFIMELEKQVVNGMTEEEQNEFSVLLDRAMENVESFINNNLEINH